MSLISQYHDLLTASDPKAEWEELVDGMQAQNLRFGTQYVCNVLRPCLLAHARYAEFRAQSHAFFGAIRTMYDWLMEDATLRGEIGLSDVEEAALVIEPGFASPDGIGRLDGFIDTGGTLRFVEYNADSPGGLGFGHVLGDLFKSLPTMQRFGEDHTLRVVPVMGDVLATLVAHYRAWGGKKETPTIGIVDWEGVGTAPEFALFRRYFEQSGLLSFISHPAALEVRQGRLWDTLSGEAIDIVYKRVLAGEILERLGLDNILTAAMRQQAACVVNSYRAQVTFKKALFALLSEHANSQHFPPHQRQAIHTHLPWTRIVRDTQTKYHGQSIDLLPFAEAQQHQLVLKPNGEYGGVGVILGWECPPDAWQTALTHAAASQSPYILQERIYLSQEVFPLWHDDSLLFEERFIDLDPYVYAPHTIRGAGVRLGASGLLNVTAGGGSAVPLVLVD